MNDCVLQPRLSRRLRPWIVLSACFMPAAATAQAISDIHIETPREFGYTIGDRIRHNVAFSLSEPYRLDTDSVPRTGRVNRWLEIVATELRSDFARGAASYRLAIDYQVFNAPQQLASVTVPPIELLLSGGANPIPVFVSQWTFTVAPITDQSARENLRLQRDRLPPTIPLADRVIRLSLFSVALTGILGYFFFRLFVLPWLQRHRFPFAGALRELRRLQRQGDDPESCRRGLQIFHAAVNASAGQAIFRANLPEFLARDARYRILGPELAELYARSQAIFFGKAAPAGLPVTLQDLIRICRQCRSLERVGK